jgi:hypothetical protein
LLTHTYTRTHTHAHAHTHMHTHTHTYIHPHTHTHTQAWPASTLPSILRLSACSSPHTHWGSLGANQGLACTSWGMCVCVCVWVVCDDMCHVCVICMYVCMYVMCRVCVVECGRTALIYKLTSHTHHTHSTARKTTTYSI